MEGLNINAMAELITRTKPYAVAFLEGNSQYPALSGLVRFYPAAGGTQVVAEVWGLPGGEAPEDGTGVSQSFYGFHIHEGERCGNPGTAEPFAETRGHYNPGHTGHPAHAGDLPPLLGSNGYAYMAVYTGRFTPEEVVGRTAVVHRHGDDLHTQPSGDSGGKIACGTIQRVQR